MTGQYPRLRLHVRRRKSGKVKTYYSYDRRPEGLPDIPLGSDHTLAVEKWREIHERAPRIAGTLLAAFEQWEAEVLPTLNKVTARDYRLCLTQLKPVLGPATWDRVTFPTLKNYLKARSAKIRANHEMRTLRVIWNWARGEGLTELPWPAAGMEKSRWMNQEKARELEVTDELFAAVYDEGDQVLQDCMDLSSATSMRLTDCRTLLLPRDDVLRLKASKTGKKVDFDVNLSEVLPMLLARRRSIKADHLMLLSTATGRKVSPTMLRDRYEAARDRAAKKAYLANDDETARQIKAMWLRDMRKYSANFGTEQEALERTQHSDVATLRKHYRTRTPKAKPAR